VLGDWGADVIKVETLEGDVARYNDANLGVPYENGTGPLWEVANANKRAISIDLKTEEGLQILDKLLVGADVFLSSNRLKALKKMGLDYETMSAKHPRIIWGHVSGYGTTGPNADEPGFDTVAYWARGGQLIDFMEYGTAPLVPPIAIADYTLGPVLAGGIAAALYKQQKTGKGSNVSISLYGLSIWSSGAMNLGTQCGLSFPRTRKAVSPINNTYKCKDGEWILLTAFDWSRYFSVVCNVLELDGFIDDPRFADAKVGVENSDAIIPAIDEIMIQRTSTEWSKILTKNDVPHSILRHIKDIVNDEQARANQYIYKYKTRTTGEFYLPSPPVQFDGPVPPEHKTAPLVGEHTREVMSELGYTEEQIKAFETRRIIV